MNRALVLVVAALAAISGRGATPARPNFLLIVADDLGFSDLGCYGGEIQTPNLDRLAAEGLRFSQFYNNAVCVPTRASLLTGLYPRGERFRLSSNMVTLAEALRAAGYQTALSGKWHLGAEAPHRPMDRGFEEFYGLADGCCNYFDPSLRDPPYEGGRVRNFFHNDQRVTHFPADYYTTDAFTDHAIATLRRFAKTGRPFFLHLAYTAPHSPIQARPEDIAKYTNHYQPGWDALREKRRARQATLKLFPREWPPAARDPKVYDWSTANQPWESLRMAVYAAMVDRMDQGIGRVLRTLRELNLETNTVVFFLSDNGSNSEEADGRDTAQTPGPKTSYTYVGPAWAWVHNTPFRRYKTWAYEGGIATPFIVRAPGITKPGALTHQMGHVMDIMPTCLEMANVPWPRTFNGVETLPPEGRSLLPVLNGGTRAGPETLFWGQLGNRAVRQGRWKLVWDSETKRWELYDMETDRTERNDVAARHPDTVRELAAAWERWAKQVGRNETRPKRAATRSTPTTPH